MISKIKFCGITTVILLSTGCTTSVGGAQNKHTIVEYRSNYSCLVPEADETAEQLGEALIAAAERLETDDKQSLEGLNLLVQKYTEIQRMELLKQAMYRACEWTANNHFDSEPIDNEFIRIINNLGYHSHLIPSAGVPMKISNEK